MLLQAEGGPPLVLASASPTRARLLRAAGLRFQVFAPQVDEEAVRVSLAAEGIATADAATTLAEIKARQVAQAVDPASVVLGADLLLEHDGQWLGKATSLEEARAQLVRLRGLRHRLVAATVGFREQQRVWHHVATAELSVRAFSDDFLDAYLDAAGEAVLGTVGCYHLEELGAQLMASQTGDFFAVLGLPLLPVLAFLREQGVILR